MSAAATHPPAHDGGAPLATRVVLRPLGSPLPLGVSGLTIASLLVTGLELGWIPMAQGTQVGFLLLATAVPLQATAAAFSLPGRDSPAAVGMGVLLTSVISQATGKLLTAIVMGLAAVRFVLTGLFELTGSAGWEHASGGVGIAVAALAVYTVCALQLEDSLRATVLPTLRRGAGRDAVARGGLSQVDGVANEAGVRQQL